MCVNCRDNDDALGTIFAAIQQAMNNNFPQKTFEELLAEKNDELDRIRVSVIKTYPIVGNVRLHLLENIPQNVVTDIINWVRRLNEVVPTSGNVDIYAPHTPDEFREGPHKDALDGATTKVDAKGRITNKVMAEDTPHRILILTHALLSDRADKTPSEIGDNPNFSMPIGQHVSNLHYTIVHEWAHVIDDRKFDDSAVWDRNMRLLSIGASRPFSAFNASLSGYGKTAEPEAFAETFTEWFLTDGKTDNFAARWYAKEYGWRMPSQFNKHK